MPISPASINCAELLMVGNVASAGSNARAFNLVFHYRRTTLVIAPNKSNFITAWQASVRGAVLAALNARLTLSSLQVRWINDAQDAYQLQTDTHVGAVTGDSMPTDQSAFILFRTGLRGRSYRGGKHLFPMSEADTTTATDDLFNAAALTRLNAAAAAMLLSLTDSDGNIWNPTILSKKLSQLKKNPTTVVVNDVSSVAVNKRVGSMLHRKVKSVY